MYLRVDLNEETVEQLESFDMHNLYKPWYVTYNLYLNNIYDNLRYIELNDLNKYISEYPSIKYIFDKYPELKLYIEMNKI